MSSDSHRAVDALTGTAANQELCEFGSFERPPPRDHDGAGNRGEAGAEHTVQTQPFERRSDRRLRPHQSDQHSQTQARGAGLDAGARAPIEQN